MKFLKEFLLTTALATAGAAAHAAPDAQNAQGSANLTPITMEAGDAAFLKSKYGIGDVSKAFAVSPTSKYMNQCPEGSTGVAFQAKITTDLHNPATKQVAELETGVTGILCKGEGGQPTVAQFQDIKNTTKIVKPFHYRMK